MLGNIPISKITVANRKRTDLGDLQSLADSIGAQGLLQPIGITPDYELVFGERRLRACVDILGWQEIPVNIVNVTSIIEGEYAENEIRKDFTLSERVAIGKAIEELLGERRGNSNVPNLAHLETSKTRDIAAEKAGFGSHSTYESAKQVIEHGVPELVKAVERGEVAVSTAAVITSLPEPEQVEVVARGEREILAKAKEIRAQMHAERKEERLTRISETPPVEGVYRIIYADPPWSYNDKCEEGSIQAGGCERHYNTMSIAALCAMPIKDALADDAVLFLWVTSPLLYEAMPIITAWGFTYKTSFVWDKIKHNMGHYNSVRHELLLVCTRGSCTPDVNKLYDSVVSLERTDRHSEKPAYFREMIDELYPHGNRIELFARKKADKWEAWGNEC